jgi:cell wall-associated NlpC family hydrolase
VKAIVIAVAAALVPFTFVIGLAMISTTSAPAVADPSASCITTGPLPKLDPAAAANARIVTAVATQRAGSRGAVIAVMTALTESALHILGNPAVLSPASPNQGWGTNLDSVGLFQQRASWGSASDRLDPVVSTTLFVTRLIALPKWRREQPWVAAQQVQVSAWDGRPRAANNYSTTFGGNYEQNLPAATRIVAEIDSGATSTSCGTLTGGLPASRAAGTHGLPSEYTIPADANKAEAGVIRYAIGQLGKPYVFGASGPAAFDCSGLVMAAWRTAGVVLPHNAAEQARAGEPTTPSALAPGDLVVVAGDDGTLAAPGHVGIYLGEGLVINAADPADGIRVQTYDNFVAVGRGLAALRHLR